MAFLRVVATVYRKRGPSLRTPLNFAALATDNTFQYHEGMAVLRERQPSPRVSLEIMKVRLLRSFSDNCVIIIIRQVMATRIRA